MSYAKRVFTSITGIVLLILWVGMGQSWSVALSIVNVCVISAIMALGVNIQWGYAGLFNIGIMGFAALGGLAAVLVATNPVTEAISASASNIIFALLLAMAFIAAIMVTLRKWPHSRWRTLSIIALVIAGFFTFRAFLDPAVATIESINPSSTGFLGGLGLPILFAWPVGGLFAAAGAWLIGRISLGLRSDYLAIATLGISEIVIAFLKNEDWISRGVKNVSGLPRPVPYEVNLQSAPWFIDLVTSWHQSSLNLLSEADRVAQIKQLVIESSSVWVKLCYLGLFSAVLVTIYILTTLAFRSPWGRMVRAIRDNETAASAMGKDVKSRHLQLFILGSAIIGIAGAMLTTLDGQFTPGTYHPLRYTFLIMVMVVIGGSGNSLGAIVGAFIIWIFWVEAEPAGRWLMDVLTSPMSDSSTIRAHLIDNAQYMRLIIMGALLLLVMRFSPSGLLPERC